MDFKKATELFADPDWDGVPEVIYEGPAPPTEPKEPKEGDGPSGITKYVVSGVDVSVLAERVQYFDHEGRLITESLKDYTRKQVMGECETLDEFLDKWYQSDKKQAVIEEMQDVGLLLEPLQQELGADIDPFDIICHIVYDQPPLTRRERADGVRKRDVFTKYGELARNVLDTLLDKYADEGVLPGEDLKVLKVSPLDKLGTPVELVKAFGGKDSFANAITQLTRQIYAV